MEYLVLMSGGYDSTVLKEYVKSKGLKYTIYHCILNTLYFDSDGESYAKYVCSVVKLNSAETLKFSENNVDEDDICSLLNVVKENSLDEVGDMIVKSSYIPARNSLLVLDAINKFYGEHSMDTRLTVLIGLIKTYPQFPDGTKEWVKSFNKFLAVEFKGRVKLEAPFIDYDKDGLYKLGCSLKVDLDKTFSCNYEKDGKECGKCGNCLWKKKHTYPSYRRYTDGRQE